MSLAAEEFWLLSRHARLVQRGLIILLGKDGYLRVLHSFQNLNQWLLHIAILELGAGATFWLLKLLKAQSEMSDLSAVTIHHWIAYIGMFGFLISEFLYEVHSLVQRVARIRASWRNGL